MKKNVVSFKVTVLMLLIGAGYFASPSAVARSRQPENGRQVSNITKAASTITDADWTPMNFGEIYGTNGPVYASVYYKKHLYIGGLFTAVGGILANNIAQWDGSSWSTLGSGVDSTVTALAVDSNGMLYAGGLFYKAGGIHVQEIARWDGNTWSALGSATKNIPRKLGVPSISCIVVNKNGIVYVAGYFSAIGDTPIKCIDQWDGANWNPVVESGVAYWGINAMTCDNAGNLYAAGTFDTLGGIPAHNVAKWDGSHWDSLQTGLYIYSNGSWVLSLVCDINGNLYAGGHFDEAENKFVYNVAKWDGSHWSSLGNGLQSVYPTGSVYALALDANGSLYAGGMFDRVNGDTSSCDIAKWDGQAWTKLGRGFYGYWGFFYDENDIYVKKCVNTMVFNESGTLFVGGGFPQAGGKTANYLAQWNENGWNPVGKTIAGPIKSQVNAIISDHRGNRYVGGTFEGGVARWNGVSWDTLGPGIRGKIESMCIDSSGNIYAAGKFDSAGGHKAQNIAQWNGTRWLALDLGLSPGPVRALVCDRKGNLFAGGEIGKAGRISAKAVAMWNGDEWDSLGPGLSSATNPQGIFSLAFDANGNLFAGGNFTIPEGYFIHYCLSKWNGSSWDTIAGWKQRQDIVGSLVFNEKNEGYLTVGIAYTNDQAVMTKCEIMKWNGSSLQSIGTMSGNAPALVFDRNGNLYASGNFDSITSGAGSVQAQGIAKWNGGKWEALGSGIRSAGKALAIEDSTLFVGGGFFTAGAQWSPYLAKVNIHNNVPAVLPGKFGSTPSLSFYCKNAQITLIGMAPQDRVVLYSLSGNILKQAIGASRIRLNDLAPQVMVLCIVRNHAILRTGIVMTP